tara:strand:- start:1067 stop:1297 length:231 start_codon:yes stop_codon:yes gene_type:complete
MIVMFVRVQKDTAIHHFGLCFCQSQNIKRLKFAFFAKRIEFLNVEDVALSILIKINIILIQIFYALNATILPVLMV